MVNINVRRPWAASVLLDNACLPPFEPGHGACSGRLQLNARDPPMWNGLRPLAFARAVNY